MKVLVANLGSTSFKYRLYDMTDERQLARGGIERIGSKESRCFVEIGEHRQELVAEVPDHAVAVRQCLDQLTDRATGCLTDVSEVSAIGFKAVHGGRVSGVQYVTDDVLDAMQEISQAAPAHNPSYIAAMRLLADRLPQIPLVAAFETGFHASIEDRHRYYAVPFEWGNDWNVKRWGFHGASHRYIATRTAELIGRNDLRVISCHLGGSSSLCAIRSGKSVMTSMGMSPQTGLPQNNRCGDFDPFALPIIMEKTGKTLNETLSALAEQSGLLGLSGISGDVRDLHEAANRGNVRARLALDLFTTSVRQYLGAMLVELGGLDALVFTGGIGENGVGIRQAVSAGLEELGIVLDVDLNASIGANENSAADPNRKGEYRISSDTSRSQIWVIPTNEEIIVARQVQELLAT